MSCFPVYFWGFGEGFGMKVIHRLSTDDEFVDDDRVLCGNCGKAENLEQRLVMPADQMEKHRKVNAKPLQWMFGEAKVKNGWATVKWMSWQCQALGISTQPLDLPHRCHLFISKAVPASVQSDAWWQD